MSKNCTTRPRTLVRNPCACERVFYRFWEEGDLKTECFGAIHRAMEQAYEDVVLAQALPVDIGDMTGPVHVTYGLCHMAVYWRTHGFGGPEGATGANGATTWPETVLALFQNACECPACSGMRTDAYEQHACQQRCTSKEHADVS